jgi:DNA-binding SARP family transcriptional activator
MPNRPPDSAERFAQPEGLVADRLQPLRESGHDLWRRWEGKALAAICDEALAGAGVVSNPALLAQVPELARWRGLACFMTESDQALFCMTQAWQGFTALGQDQQASLTAQMALVFCLVDNGAASRTTDWLTRAGAADAANAANAKTDLTPAVDGLWPCLGAVAQVALGAADSARSAAAAHGLHEQLRSSPTSLSADERLLCALMLLEYRFATQRYDQLMLLVHTVEVPVLFEPASDLLRARWVLMTGYIQHLTGNAGEAEATWQRALLLASQQGCATVEVQARLALVRKMLDSNRLEEAKAQLARVVPQTGHGRLSQLIQLQQQRARLLMLSNQPASALSLLQDVLHLTDEAAWPEAEKSSCLHDLTQVYVALDRADEAMALLTRIAGARQGHDGAVFICLSGLVKAWLWRHAQPQASRQALASALAAARQARMQMFFRQLPTVAANLCALALQWQVEPHFVTEVIRNRSLAAPEDADSAWPWPLWLGLIGGFEWRLHGQTQRSSGKAQQKPLELLRLLACSRQLSMGTAVAAEALWPDAEAGTDLGNLDVAIHRLRKLLGDASLVWVHDNRVGLDSGRVSSDVRLRRQLVERIEQLAMRPAAAGDDTTSAANECRQRVARLVAMTTSALLADAPDAAWLLAERQRFRQDTVRAALAAANVLARDPLDEAERSLLEAALNAEPLAEALVRRLAQAYGRVGLKGDALRVLNTHLRHLQEAGGAPGASLLALRTQLLAQ